MKTKTSEVKEHSEFGGSQAERIINCPGSVLLSRGVPNKTNDASEEGTAGHACLEFIFNNRKLLKNKITRKQILDKAEESFTIGESGKKIYWTQDMIDYALDALSWFNEQLSPSSTVYVEQKLDASKFTTDDQGSTLDLAMANWNARELLIADYKYGKSVVNVENNSQLIYYALGMLVFLKGWSKFDRIRCVIIQPRAHHKDGPIREWVISVDDAIVWGKRFKKAVNLALKPNAPLKYSDKYCFFCLGKKKCPVMKTKQTINDFDEIPTDEKEVNVMAKATKKASKKKASKKKVSKKSSK